MNTLMKNLNLSDDFLFAKVMSDPAICKKVLEKILNIEILKIEMPEEQKTIDLLLESKGIRLDIYVNDENQTIYNIEMQRSNHKNLAKRSRYYQGNIDLDLISKGEDYIQLKKSFVIFICTFDPFGENRHLYTFANTCLQNPYLALGDDTYKVFLNTKGTLDDVDYDLKAFLKYIEESTDEFVSTTHSQLVKAIHTKVQQVKNDQRMEVEYMTLLERDKEKYLEGLEQGIEQGIEQGEAQSLKIFKLYLEGMNATDIAKKLNLPFEKVNHLLKSLKE